MLLTASRIIEQSWHTYLKNWKHFLPYSIILGLIMFLSSFTSLIQPIEYKYGLITDNGVILFIGILVFIVLSTLLTMVISVAFTLALKDALDNRSIRPIKTALHDAKSFLWPVLYTSILVALLIIVGTIALIVPGIIFMVWYVFSTYEVLFDGKRGGAALKSSKALVLGRWWKMLWRLIVPSFVYGIAMWVILLATLLPLNLRYIGKVDTNALRARVNYLIIQGEGDVSKLSSSEQRTYLLNYHPEMLLPLPILVLNNAISSIVYMLFIPLSYCAFLILYVNAKQHPVNEDFLPSSPLLT